jgi:integrase
MHPADANRIWRIHLDRYSGPDAPPVLAHWRDFVETWQKCRKSVSTISNVASTFDLLCPRAGLVTFEAWNDASGAFHALHALADAMGWSPATFNTYRKNANTYFAFLKRKGIIAGNPIGHIEKMRERQRNYPLPSKVDFAKITHYLLSRPCPNLLERKRNVLFFRLLETTSARPDELLSLALGNVEDRKSVRIDGAKIGGKPRAYPLPDHVREALRDYIQQAAVAGRSGELADHLFLGKAAGWHWTYSGVRKLLERINKESGTETPVTCYSYRRNAATSLYRRGTPLEQISKHMGHSRSATTMRYIQGIPEVNAGTVAALAQEYAPGAFIPS